MSVIYVITWRWLDGSGSGAVSAHWTKGEAETMLIVLGKNGDSAKQFVIEAIPCGPLP